MSGLFFALGGSSWGHISSSKDGDRCLPPSWAVVGGEGRDGWAPCQPISWRALIAWAEIAAALACLLFLPLSVQANVERLCRGRPVLPPGQNAFLKQRWKKGSGTGLGCSPGLFPAPGWVSPHAQLLRKVWSRELGILCVCCGAGVKARRGEERATAGKMPGSHQGASRGFPLISFLRCYFVT